MTDEKSGDHALERLRQEALEQGLLPPEEPAQGEEPDEPEHEDDEEKHGGR
jgi:hypothetical protein